MNLMRPSLKKAAGCPILRAFCEGWDTTNLDTDRRVSHPLQRAQRTPDSCHAALDKTACAPFSKERRMKFAEPSKLNRNPGGMGHPPFRGASCRAKHPPRPNGALVSAPPNSTDNPGSRRDLRSL